MLSESFLLVESLGFFIPGLLFFFMFPPLVILRLESLIGVSFPILSKYSVNCLTFPGFWRFPEPFQPPGLLTGALTGGSGPGLGSGSGCCS